MSKQILIIDDNKDILYTMSQICKYEGWISYLASNYNEAMFSLDTNNVDLILVDYHMPEIDGISVVKGIRRKFQKIPIIVLTVEEGIDVAKKFMEAGATDYSLKPIKAIDIISRIKSHLKYSEQNKYYNDTKKGISKNTLNILSDYLKSYNDFVDINIIEINTKVKQKTIYRYLQYMLEENLIEVKYAYGKMGRPKTYYKIM